MKMRRINISIALIALSGAVVAHQGATGVVLDRMNGMLAIQDATKALAQISAGKTDFDPDAVLEAADKLSKHAAEIPMVFATKDLSPPSESSPSIWEDWERFVALSVDLERAAQDASLSESAADLAVQVKTIAQSCKACHADYRK